MSIPVFFSSWFITFLCITQFICFLTLINAAVIPGLYEVIVSNSLGNGTSEMFFIHSNVSTLDVIYPDASLINSTVTNSSFLVAWTPDDDGSSMVDIYLNQSINSTSYLISLGSFLNFGFALFNLSELVPAINPGPGWNVIVSSPIYGEGQSFPTFTFISPPNISVVVQPTTVVENSNVTVSWYPFNPAVGSGIVNVSIVNSSNTSQVFYVLQLPDTGNGSVFINGSLLIIPGNYSVIISSAYGIGTSSPIVVQSSPPVFPVTVNLGVCRVGLPFSIGYSTLKPLTSLSFRLVSFSGTSANINVPAPSSPTTGRGILFVPQGFPSGPSALYITANGVDSPPVFVSVYK